MKTLLFLLCSSVVGLAADPYPLTTCLVSDDPLGAHTKAKTIYYQGQEVRLCCSDCIADFKKDPARYLAKLKQAQGKR